MDTKNYNRATAYFRRMELSYPGDDDWGKFADAMDEVISTCVPVVRCKNCKWWDKEPDAVYGYCHACKHGYHSSNWEIGIYRKYKADWFCANGERK